MTAQQYAEAGGYFAIIPSRACRDRAMTGRLLQLLCLLGTYTSAKKRGFCWPSRGLLAREMGVSKPLISRMLKQLQDLGYIEIRPRTTEAGDSDTNMYRVLYDPELPTERDTAGEGGNLQTLPPGGNLQTLPGVVTSRRYQGGNLQTLPRMANGKAEKERLNQSLAPEARERASAKLTKQSQSQKPDRTSTADPEREAFRAALLKYPSYFGTPRTPSEHSAWNRCITELLAGDLRAGDVPRLVNAWKRKYPNAQLTVHALREHAGELLPAPIVPTAPRPELLTDEYPTTTIPDEETDINAHDDLQHDPAALDSADTPEQTSTLDPSGPASGPTIDDLRARADAARLAARAKVRAALAQANRAAAEVAPRRGGLALAARPSRQVPQL